MTTQTIAELYDLSGKGAVVTGGAMGIGKGIAFRLAEAGASVMIADINLEAAKQTVEEIESRGARAQAVYADVRSAADAKKVAKAMVEAFGSLDILVNNAGIYPLMPLMQVTEELWDKVLDVNLKGSFLYAQAAAEEMIKVGRGGRIINIASIDAMKPQNMGIHYNASKGGVVMLTKALALELAPHRILVNTVAPGGIMTPGIDAANKGYSQATGIEPEILMQGFVQRVPLQHRGEPDDIAKVVLFLASAAADYVTGSLLLVDGGYLLS